MKWTSRYGPQQLFFLFLRIGILASFTSFVGFEAFKRIQSLHFNRIDGTIIENRLDCNCDSNAGLRLSFSYNIDGKNYTSDRLTAGHHFLFDDDARELAAIYPIGAKVAVWWNPENRFEATLQRGMGRGEWFCAFIAAGIIVIALPIFYKPRRKPANALRIISERNQARVRLSRIPPVAAFFVTLFFSAIVSTLLLSILSGFDDHISPSVRTARWWLVLATALGVALRRKYLEDSGREDLVLSHLNHQITLPLSCGRKSPVTLPFVTIRRVFLETVHEKDSEGDDRYEYYPTIVLNNETHHRLAKLHMEEQANELVDWLRQQIEPVRENQSVR